MASPVIVDFIINGIPNVAAAMKSVERATMAAERSAEITARRGAQARIKLANDEAREKIRAYQKADRWHAQAQDKATRDVQRTAQAELRAREQAARATIRNEEKTAREIGRIKERSAAEAGRIVRRQEADAARWVRKGERQQFIQQRDEYRNRQHFASHIAGAVGHGVMTGASKVAGKVTQTAHMLGQLGGGFDIGGSVERSARNSGDLEDLLNSAYNPTSGFTSNKRRREASEVLPEIQGTAQRWGLQREGVQGGMRAFQGATGDMETNLKLMEPIAEMARATGTEFHTLMDAAGGVAHVLDNVTDSTEKANLVMKVMRTGAGQGKAGAFELKDQAAVMAKMVASAGKFEGDNVDNIIKLMALAQGARSGGGAWNAASAATSIGAFTSTFGKGARLEAFRHENIDVFTDKKKDTIRAPEQLIAEAMDKTHGDQERLTKLFGSVMGMRAVNKMAAVYKEGEEGKITKDGKKLGGKEAVLDWVKTMTKDAGMSKGDVSDAAKRRMGGLDAKMASMREKLDAAVEEKIIPVLLTMIPEFEKLMDTIVDLNAQALPAFVDLFKTIAQFADTHKGMIQDIAAHPIGAIMAAEIGKSVAQAGISEVFRAGINRAFGDAGLGTAIGSALNTSMGKAVAGGLIVATAAIAIQQGMIAIDQVYEKENKDREGRWKDMTEAGAMTKRFQNGTATDEDRANAKKMVAQLGADATAQGNEIDNPGLIKKLSRGAASVVAPEAVAEEAAQQRIVQAQLIKTMQELTAATRANAAATTAGGAKPASGGAPGPRATTMTQRN